MKRGYFQFPMIDGLSDAFQLPGTRTTGTAAQTYAITGPALEGNLLPVWPNAGRRRRWSLPRRGSRAAGSVSRQQGQPHQNPTCHGSSRPEGGTSRRRSLPKPLHTAPILTPPQILAPAASAPPGPLAGRCYAGSTTTLVLTGVRA
ncbi:DUF1254 domain-containing protein [Xanthobacter versatilis]|uniref:DUF1254 domain-containing protein n=1 Tax=Xanthobacter autotrophicus (strain ATCC BAA-1158 / Py2) TaxID=78245 RepID=UPI00372C4CE8